jgi:hypothetical protein
LCGEIHPQNSPETEGQNESHQTGKTVSVDSQMKARKSEESSGEMTSWNHQLYLRDQSHESKRSCDGIDPEECSKSHFVTDSSNG